VGQVVQDSGGDWRKICGEVVRHELEGVRKNHSERKLPCSVIGVLLVETGVFLDSPRKRDGFSFSEQTAGSRMLRSQAKQTERGAGEGGIYSRERVAIPAREGGGRWVGIVRVLLGCNGDRLITHCSSLLSSTDTITSRGISKYLVKSETED